ncbi:hypothetical protein D0Y65_025507 [Glycine soja]|uniref:Uncharacterized protein n=1 Tax=Glycine soja TaxID=3848 RepID=A0A445J7A7_GLYSO|nr:hypothetical protein D0Y65_025507 [Glycine soja]
MAIRSFMFGSQQRDTPHPFSFPLFFFLLLSSLSLYISLFTLHNPTPKPLSPKYVGNMSWRSVRGSRKRKMDFELDLNRDPPLVREEEEEEEEGGPSRHQQHHHHQQEPQTPIVDVDAIDDDVVESSPRSFAQAKSNADERRRVRRRTTIVDLDSGSVILFFIDVHSGLFRSGKVKEAIFMASKQGRNALGNI